MGAVAVPRLTDRGMLVAGASIVLMLIGVAALLTARVAGTMVRASVHESLAAQERATTRAASELIDAWMRDPNVSETLTTGALPVDYFNAVGGGCVWGVDTACWHLDSVAAPAGIASELRGGEAQRVIVDVAATVVTGCDGPAVDDCRREGQFARRYERTVFSQYQLHYSTHDFPAAPEALAGPDGVVGTIDDLTIAAGAVIVFTSADALSGPVRTELSAVLHCGSPTFDRVEVAATTPDPPVMPFTLPVGCAGIPLWDPAHPTPGDASALIADERIVYAGSGGLRLPGTDSSRTLAATPAAAQVTQQCTAIDSHPTLPPTVVGPGVCNTIVDGDVVAPPAGIADLTVHRLEIAGTAAVPGSAAVRGSVTVYAPGDIVVAGDIAATGPPGGPHVVALIAGGDIRIEPDSATGATCLDPSHSITMNRVAVLAPTGAVFAPRWSAAHCVAGTSPNLTIVGSIAAQYLGVYGVPDPASGGTIGGWTKQYDYPPDFWLARPVWWPGFVDDEWVPVSAAEVDVVDLAATAATSATPPAVATFAAADIAAYLLTRDELAAAMVAYGTWTDAGFVSEAGYWRSQYNLNTLISLGESNPNQFQGLATVAAWRDALDIVAIASGLPLTPTVSLTGASAAEDAGTLEFVVSVTPAAATEVTVTYATRDGTAAAPGDYIAATGSVLRIPAGAATATISVTVNDDTAHETTETFTLIVSAPTGAQLTGGAPWLAATGTIDDDDDPAVVVSFTSAAHTVAEGFSTTVTVNLDTDPQRTVEIPLTSTAVGATSADHGEIPMSVIFAAGQTSQRFTFAATADRVTDDGETVTIGFGTVPAGVSVTAVSETETTITITNVAVPDAGVVVSETAVTVVEGDPAGATYTVVLNAAPAAAVTVTPAVTGDSTVTAAPAALTFTAADWDTAQTVTVTAADDTGSVNAAAQIGHTATSADTGYDRVAVASVTVTVADDDIPGVSVSETAVTVVEGDPAGATYTVVLNAAPAAAVTVTPAVTGDSTVTAAPAALTFTAADWDTAQTVTVTAADDDDSVNAAAQIGHTATSADTGYDRVAVASVTVTVADDDIPGVSVSETAVTVVEGDPAAATYTVVLNAAPAAAVTVTPAVTGDTTVTAAPAALTFTAADWDTAQTVTVTAADDDDSVNAAAQIGHTATSADTGYDRVAVASVTVTVADDDTDGVSVSETAVTVVEGGAAATYTVVLDTAPTATVTVTAADTAGAVTAIPPALTFTAADWDTAQTVTVTAVDDDDSEGEQQTTVTHTVAGYGTVTAAAGVAVTVTDDDYDPSIIPIVHSNTWPNTPTITSVECIAGITVEWDAPTGGGPVAGYRVNIQARGRVNETLETETVATSAVVALADGTRVAVVRLYAFNHDPATDAVQLGGPALEYAVC